MNDQININADVGEGKGDDAGLMPLIQACNIACGGHAGGRHEVKKTIALAKKHNVLIGAHPSYPDREYFGRRSMKINKETLYQSIVQQMFLILEELLPHELHHVKPHGALYHDCNTNEGVAHTFIEVVQAVCPNAIIFTAPNSVLKTLALQRGIETWDEAFLDRGYQDNGQLSSRSEKDAVLKTEEDIYRRLENLVQKRGVFSVTQKWIPIEAKTFCIHGDHPNAALLLSKVVAQYFKNNS
jgi:UPF0271 protein